MTQKAFDRRAMLSAALGVVAAFVGVRQVAAQKPAPALPHLDEKDKLAVSLGYVADAKKVDVAKHPTYKPTQTCANCFQIAGKDGDAWRPCKMFAGKAVAAAGWCKVWVRKAS
jgi:hypothetical protein